MNTYPEEMNILFMSFAQISFKVELYANELEIQWGDGEISTYRDHHFFSIMHQFSSEGLQNIRIKGEKISSLNVSRLSLTSLSLVNCPALEYLDCSVNELSHLNLSHCPALEELYCNSNNLIQLDLSSQSTLREANVSYNLIETLDISNCQNLRSLHCYNNRLSLLRLNSTPAIEDLNLGNNLLDQEQLDSIFQQLSVTETNKTIHYTQNPGTDFCNPDLLKPKIRP